MVEGVVDFCLVLMNVEEGFDFEYGVNVGILCFFKVGIE